MEKVFIVKINYGEYDYDYWKVLPYWSVLAVFSTRRKAKDFIHGRLGKDRVEDVRYELRGGRPSKSSDYAISEFEVN